MPRPARLTLAVAALALAPALARAHFVLLQPESWRDQNFLGDPQKLGPCGDDGDAALTGIVTTFRQGETITVKIKETIPHPGHYRVALAVNDRSELPPYPEVTEGTTPCGSAEIDPDPEFPVLVDGALVHTTPFETPQTIEVTLPDDITCEKCTLQVIEFMSDHGLNNPGGCFYSHCAEIAIVAAETEDTEPDGETDGTTDDASDEAGAEGCSCATPVGAAAGLPALLLVGAALARRRRR